MIIKFSVENWLSFRNQASISMVATRERQHIDRIPTIEKYSTKILPIAAIYGGNASGKTNFFEALNFVKNFIVRGSAQPDDFIKIEMLQAQVKENAPVLVGGKNAYFQVTRKNGELTSRT